MKLSFKAYRLIAFEIVGRISIASSTASEAVGRERSGGYTYEMPWDCVLDVHLGREERSLEEEHAIFTHIVHKKSISKPKAVDLDGMTLPYQIIPHFCNSGFSSQNLIVLARSVL